MASAAVCLAAAASPRHFPSSPLLSPPLLRHNRRKLTPSPPPRLRRPLSLPPIGSSFRDRIRPVDAVETDLLPSDVRKRAMDAVDSYGRRVTIGDVAGRAGLKLNEAERALQALTADSGGFLEVSDEGDVLYVFPRDYRAKLAAKSFRMKAEPVIAKIKAGAEYLIRVAFGTALVTSIMLVYTAIIVLLRSEDDNRERRRGRSYSPGFSVYMSPTDLFWFWDPYYHRRRQTRTDEGMNFVESVFSFVFGDGNPNQGLEEERLANIYPRMVELLQRKSLHLISMCHLEAKNWRKNRTFCPCYCGLMDTLRLMSWETFSTDSHHCKGQHLPSGLAEGSMLGEGGQNGWMALRSSLRRENGCSVKRRHLRGLWLLA